MPATARLRVNGAITRRFGSVTGPNLKGSNSFVGVFIFVAFGGWRAGWAYVKCAWRAVLASHKPFDGCRRAAQDPSGRSINGWRVALAENDSFEIGKSTAWPTMWPKGGCDGRRSFLQPLTLWSPLLRASRRRRARLRPHGSPGDAKHGPETRARGARSSP